MRALALAGLLALPAGAGAESGELAELAMVRQGDVLVAYARNLTAGPLQVELSSRGPDAGSVAGLPLRQTLAPRARVALARFNDSGVAPTLQLDSTPGEPGHVARDVVYSLPVDERGFELGQGFHGGYSHADTANRYAVDLIVPEGTAVLAARGGVVMSTVSGYSEGGADPALAGRANLVRVLHEDGSMGLYAHLQEGGVLVKPGETVTLGQQIGRTGSTGYSSGPHLHFAVQLNGGMRLVSIPFRMVGPDGYLPLHK
ncbi:MAG: M23 family metallopeptidase [Arenimonas sp.]|nr:M23 family metallopeptidase [Arenimonas sp.]